MTAPVSSAFEQLTNSYASGLAERMKKLEKSDDFVDSNSPFIIRLDGVAFHTFVKGLIYPFDHRLTRAMVLTSIDLIEKFNAVSAYHQSDEISLVFPAVNIPEQNSSKKRKTNQSHIYNGRYQKLASVTASYASIRLNFHLANLDFSDCSQVVVSRMKSHTAYFDGRVIPSTASQITECLFWRSNFDGFRNAVGHIAQNYFKVKELQNKSVFMQYEMLLAKNIDLFKEYSSDLLFGTIIKKQKYELEGCFNPVTKKPVETPVIRTRCVKGSFNWADYSEKDREELIMAKFWPKEDSVFASLVELQR